MTFLVPKSGEIYRHTMPATAEDAAQEACACMANWRHETTAKEMCERSFHCRGAGSRFKQ
jgi:hypothetical protein